MTNENLLPDYDEPPVIEVVCGVHFQRIDSLIAPYLGLLWEKIRKEFPLCKEVAPLAPVIERFGANDQSTAELAIPDILSLSRIWFESQDGNGLIQVQRDRFLHNWKKEHDKDEYPHFDFVIKNFRTNFETFKAFIKENNLGSIQLLQCELTYVNHIPQGEAWTKLSDTQRFLPTLEACNWQTSFVLPEREGRLRTSIRLGKRRSDNHPIILFELTARGIGTDKNDSGIWPWFDLAHKWIVEGFTDLTSKEVQQNVWRRKR